MHLFHLGMGTGDDLDAPSDPVAAATYDPNGFDCQLAVCVSAFVAKQHPFLIQIHHENISITFVIIIATGGTTPHLFD